MDNELPNELPKPAGVEVGEESIEILRAWIIDEHLECAIAPRAFEQPEVWGMLLADLARQVADGWAASGDDAEAAEALDRIVSVLGKELQDLSADPENEAVS
ncbi:MAG: DUF5076 domain-containing protein [Acidobacteriota bacterium]